MTVAELIEKLKSLDPSLKVVSPGFDECGYDDAELEVIEIAPMAADRTSVYRTYDDVDDLGVDPSQAFKAVKISFS